MVLWWHLCVILSIQFHIYCLFSVARLQVCNQLLPSCATDTTILYTLSSVVDLLFPPCLLPLSSTIADLCSATAASFSPLVAADFSPLYSGSHWFEYKLHQHRELRDC